MATFDVSKIKSYTNSILKEECKKHKLKVGGAKKDLCDRLEEFFKGRLDAECEDKDVEELDKKMKKLKVGRQREDEGTEDEEKARAIYPDISSTTIAFARKRGIGLVDWARRLKKTRKERDEYWASRGI